MDKKEQKKTRSTNVMPHNIEAEQAVLAACIMDNEIAYSILNDISKDDFYSNALLYRDSARIYFDLAYIVLGTISSYLMSAVANWRYNYHMRY